MIQAKRRGLWGTVLIAASGLLAALACGDTSGLFGTGAGAVTGVTVSPPTATLNVGDKLTLTATISASGNPNRSVRWTSSNASVATVDGAGQVTAIAGGSTSIIATSASNPLVTGVAAITVGSFGFVPTIAAINQGGKAADLGNISGQIDVLIELPAPPPTFSTVRLVINCDGTDTVVASQALADAGSAAALTQRSTAQTSLSFNTAPFKNGQCSLKVQAATTTGAIVGSSSTRITLNNPMP